MKRFIGGCILIGFLGGCAQLPAMYNTPEPNHDYALNRQIALMYSTASKQIMPRVGTNEYALKQPESIDDIRRYFHAPKVPKWNGLPVKPSFEDSELSNPGLVIRELIEELSAIRDDYRTYHSRVLKFESDYDDFLEKQNQRYGNKK